MFGINPAQFGIKKIVIKKGEKVEDVKNYVSDKAERVIIVIYEFDSRESRDAILNAWKQAQALMQMG
jgi:hypothetical protein